MDKIRIGTKLIGNNEPCFTIAEAGANHDGNLENAFKLIDAAKNANVDCIKFQTYKSETVYVSNAGESNYLSESGIKESITKIFTDLSMPCEMIPILAEYCKNKNIRVNCISPGGILDGQPKVFLEKYNSSCSGKGMMDARDLNGTIVYLLSDMSQYLNGQNIIIDDGWGL